MTAAQLISSPSWAVRSLRRRGLRATGEVVLSSLRDLTFDWRFGINTRTIVPRAALESSLVNRAHAVAYQPSKAGPFLSLMRLLSFPPGSTFVDVGSGKGRILLLAAQSEKFERVVGVEFSASLCSQARENIAICAARAVAMTPIQVIQADASQRIPEPGENVFFLYNPFDGEVLAAFLDRLRESLDQAPRPVWLIYSVPMHSHVIDACGFLRRRQELRLAGNKVHVYEGSGA